ncbi:MAG: hypothetical protein AABX73_04435 [Nanoarchaeota archaeon]
MTKKKKAAKKSGEKPKFLDKRIEDWKSKGKSEEEITWGMLDQGFRSISGIPDDFYSAEDPDARVRLWEERGMDYTRGQYHAEGRCSVCGSTYCARGCD